MVMVTNVRYSGQCTDTSWTVERIKRSALVARLLRRIRFLFVCCYFQRTGRSDDHGSRNTSYRTEKFKKEIKGMSFKRHTRGPDPCKLCGKAHKNGMQKIWGFSRSSFG